MNCLICGKEAGFNRAMIDLYSGTKLGGLCMNCEKEEFGKTLEYSITSESQQCRLCERDGQIQLPKFVSKAESLGDDVVVKSSIEESESAPALCDEHFHMITDSRKKPAAVRI